MKKLTRDEAKAAVTRALRKRDKKSINDLAREVQVHPKSLTYVMRDLVDDGVAVKQGVRPTLYTKA